MLLLVTSYSNVINVALLRHVRLFASVLSFEAVLIISFCVKVASPGRHRGLAAAPLALTPALTVRELSYKYSEHR